MELEVRGMNAATRRQLGAKIKTYRETLTGLKRDLTRAKEKTARDSLLAGGKGSTYGSGAAPLSDDSRAYMARAEATTSRAAASTAMLEDARRELAETHEVADGTLSELSRQREVLDRTRSKVGQVNAGADLARRILGSMQNRDTRFKACIGVFALVVVILIIIVVYFAMNKPAEKKT